MGPLNKGRDRSPGNTRGFSGGGSPMGSRSTKAGTEAPATPPSSVARSTARTSLNKGRDRSPGNTRVLAPRRLSAQHRSTKAGTEAPATPQDTRQGQDGTDGVTAQQRPGPKPRQHRPSQLACDRGPAPLNKGRDRSPGNTPDRAEPAERGRPRSTKAGTEAPATLPWDTLTRLWGDVAQQRPGPKPRQHRPHHACAPRLWNAQQRPGPKPRQHLTWASSTTGAAARSTKAGTEAPATHPTPSAASTPSDRRSTKAGTEAPATRERSWPCPRSPRPLNKGRDRSPGNTGGQKSPLNAKEPAQQRPGPKPRQHWKRLVAVRESTHRSTKAGTEAPATRARP